MSEVTEETPPGDNPPASADEIDHFLLYDLYHDANTLFVPPAPITEILGDCEVVLDTNVLLRPYTIRPTSFTGIIRTLETVAGQASLTVPGHAVREFAKHRSVRLKEFYSDLTPAKEWVDPSAQMIKPIGFLEEEPEYQALLAIQAEAGEYQKDILPKFRDLKKAHNDARKNLQTKIANWNWADPVSQAYKRIFTGSVIRDFKISQEDLAKDYARRKALRIPPGYEDKEKEAGAKDGGPKSVNAIGDLAIWHTILELGAEKKKPLIFVTEEKKPDWWVVASGTPLYPRYELIDEYRAVSGGSDFYIVSFSTLLKLFKASASVVEEVTEAERRDEIATQAKNAAGIRSRMMAVEALTNLLMKDDRVTLDISGGAEAPDIVANVATVAGPVQVGYDVVFFAETANDFSDFWTMRYEISNLISRGSILLEQSVLQQYTIYMIGNTSIWHFTSIDALDMARRASQRIGTACWRYDRDGRLVPSSLGTVDIVTERIVKERLF